MNPPWPGRQTDNGGEFVGLAEENWGGHFPIPPGAKTYRQDALHNSDVEAFHRRIEEEFYRIEPINSYLEFFGKAKTYLLMPTHIQWFNYQRNNHYKDGSPLKLLKESKENDYLPEIFNLSPLAGQAVLLDNYINKITGYNLPVKYSALHFFS